MSRNLILFRPLDLVPVARAAMMKSSNDATIVLDGLYRIYKTHLYQMNNKKIRISLENAN